MIIANNFQRLYSPCTHSTHQIIFTINGHLIPIDKLNKAYTHQKMEFTGNRHGEIVIPTQCQMALTISLLKLSLKE